MKLTEIQIKTLKDLKTPVPRKLMDKEEIAMCKKLLALGLVNKGTTDDKQASVMYYTTNEGLKLI